MLASSETCNLHVAVLCSSAKAPASLLALRSKGLLGVLAWQGGSPFEKPVSRLLKDFWLKKARRLWRRLPSMANDPAEGQPNSHFWEYHVQYTPAMPPSDRFFALQWHQCSHLQNNQYTQTMARFFTARGESPVGSSAPAILHERARIMPAPDTSWTTPLFAKTALVFSFTLLPSLCWQAPSLWFNMSLRWQARLHFCALTSVVGLAMVGIGLAVILVSFYAFLPFCVDRCCAIPKRDCWGRWELTGCKPWSTATKSILNGSWSRMWGT